MSSIQTPGFARSLVACAIASLSLAAVAQENGQQEVSDADTIVVTATRFAEPKSDAPTKIDVITRKEIERSGAFDVPEVLQTVGGLNVIQQGGAQFGLDSAVDMGGFGAGTAAANTMVLVDGMRMNPIDLSNVPWASIPISSVDRIEIQSGGSPVLYGSGAVGGVINIITQDSNKSINQANITAGSFGTAMFNARSANTVDHTRYDVMLSGQNSDGWRANSATSVGNASLRLTQDLGAGDKVYAEGSMFSSFNGMPSYLPGKVGTGTPQNSLKPFDSAQNNGSRVLTGVSQSISDLAKFEGEFTYNNQNTTYNSFNYNTSYGAYGARSGTSNINKWNLDVTPRIKFDFGALGKTILGFDYQQAAQGSINDDALYGGSYSSTANARVINRSFYLSQNTDLFSELGLTLGVRRQTQQVTLNSSDIAAPNQSAENSATGAEAGLNYKYMEGQRAYFRYARSFRFATTDEFWAYGYDPTTYAYYSFLNKVIKPQTGNEFDLGGEWTLDRHKLSAMIYTLKTNNEIQLVPNGYNQYNVNLPSVEHRGIKLSDRWQATDNLSFNGGVTYQTQKMSNGTVNTTDGPLTFNAGANMSGVPNWLVNLSANYQIATGVSTGVLMNYVGPQYYTGDIQNQYPKMPGYFVGDLYGQYKFSDSTLRLTVKNFTDNSYASFGGYSTSANKFYYYPNNPLAVYISYSISIK